MAVEIFVEKHRHRLGKVEYPNDRVFDFAASSFIDGIPGDKIRDLKVVPITVNYERLFEGESFPFELTGEGRVNESLSRFFGSVVKNTRESYGRVRINICKPLSYNEHMASYKAQNFPEAAHPRDLNQV
jgi:glycerol-3-phosphate O-acyltransferase